MIHRATRVLGALFLITAACIEAEDLEPSAAEETDEIDFRAIADARLPVDTDLPGPTTAFHGGVVSTTEPLAANIGRDILAAGGNAVDAAVAVQFMLNVIEPQSSGMGGGGFMLIHKANEPPERTIVIDFRDLAVASATRSMYDTSASTETKETSGYAVGVPGTVKGMLYAMERYGSKAVTRTQVMTPAILAARNGFFISSRLAGDTNSSRLRLETSTNSFNKGYYNEARAVFRPNGNSLATGTRLRQLNLATTLEAIAARGANAFYRCNDPSGIALAIVETQTATRSNYSTGRGGMKCSDLENYTLRVFDPVESPDQRHAPLVGDYHGYTIVTAPPPSSGVFLLQMLDMIEVLEDRVGFAYGAGTYAFGQVGALNVMQELMRAAFADRSRWLGDPDFYPVPVDGLLDPDYVTDRAALITPGTRRATSFPVGTPPTIDAAKVVQEQAGNGKGKSEGKEGIDTTHFTVIDKWGNVVSVTSTISDTWGAGLMVRGRGFMLNNQLLNFNDTPQGTAANPAANDVQPKKRPRTTIAPVLVFLENRLVAAYGAPGGTGILNALLQVTLNLIDHKMGVRDAIARPRLSLDSGSSTANTEIEAGFAAGVRTSLQNMGYDFDNVTSIAAVQAIVTYPTPDNLADQQYGAADTRRIGGVSGLDEH